MDIPPSHKVTDVHVSLLLNAGLLARHASDRGLYLFGVPNTGPLVGDCVSRLPSLLGSHSYTAAACNLINPSLCFSIVLLPSAHSCPALVHYLCMGPADDVS
jgi:hypothetical protein